MYTLPICGKKYFNKIQINLKKGNLKIIQFYIIAFINFSSNSL